MTYIALIASFLIPLPLLAHGIGQRIDLAIPLDIYLGAATAVVILSFFIIAFLGKRTKQYDDYPSFDLFTLRFFRFLVHPLFLLGIKALSVAFLFVLIFAGFFGDQTPTDNILPIFVWVAFTVFLTYFVAFVGNVWAVLNPWKTLHELFDAQEKFSFHCRWPTWLGVWPAFALMFGFRFVENIYPNATNPEILAGIISAFSVITFIGMVVFGRRQWLAQGDPFSVFFDFLSRVSILVFEKTHTGTRLMLRLPCVGILKSSASSLSETAFVLLMLASVSFDGVSSTAQAVSFLTFFLNNGVSLVAAKTILFVAVFALFVGMYVLFALLIKNYARTNISVSTIAHRFVLSLLPIAVVYEVAHFTTLLITEGQRVFILLSDPFGFEWNLFGTALNTVNYSFINFKLLWNFEVALILLGHVASLYIAHMVALLVFSDAKQAVRSQVPMLVLMVVYTVLGLWILAQPPALIG